MGRSHDTAIIVASLCALAPAPALANAGWINDGVPLCTASGEQIQPRIVSDAAGGCLVVWPDARSGIDFNVYVQRIGPTGNILWRADGIAISHVIGNEYPLDGAPDGSGGAIIAWEDQRNGLSDICAQRIDSTGVTLWPLDGRAVCTATGDQGSPRIAPDGQGGAIIVWEDYRNGARSDIYAQRIDASGAALWPPHGIPICVAPRDQNSPRLALDAAGSVIIGWRDFRSGEAWHVFVQRVLADGSIAWTENGVLVCAAIGTQSVPALAPDGEGGVLVSWSETRAHDEDIYMQSIDSNGDALWADGAVVVCNAGYSQLNMQLLPDGRKCAIAVWEDNRGGPLTTDIYAQRIDSTGAALWEPNGVVVCSATYDQIGPQAVSDGSRGAIIVWSDARYRYFTNPPYDIFAQRVGAEGTIKWKQDGIRVCAAENAQGMPRITCDGSGGAFVAWQDYRSGASNDIFGQRIDAAGHVVVGTLLRGFAALIVGADIEIRWNLSEAGENTRFAVFREGALSGSFDEIPAPRVARSDLSFTFVDGSCEPGEVYRYRVGVCDGSTRTILFETDPLEMPPMPLTLFPCAPNPFGSSTSIRFYLPAQLDVSIEVYDASGTLVRRLVRNTRERGIHRVEWNGCDDHGTRAAPGMYFCRLKAGKEARSRKMVLSR